jgi:hypothetical protein
MDNEAHHRTVEGGVAKRETLGRGLRELDSAALGPGLGEHLGRRVDSPDLRATLCERARYPSGAAADIEDTAGEQIPVDDKGLEQLRPALVGRTQPVVARGERPEVRA